MEDDELCMSRADIERLGNSDCGASSADVAGLLADHRMMRAEVAKLRAERDAAVAKLERVRAWASRQNAWTENELLAILDGKEGV